MEALQNGNDKMTNYRWVICSMLFFATTVNYLDRQVLSLTWDEFIKPEFHWNESHYGTITSIFSLVYAVCMIFAGKFIDWMGTKKGYRWAIGIWSLGACMHAGCGIFTEYWTGIGSKAALIGATGDVVVTISTVSMYAFLAARCILALGESGNFPAAIKVTAEYFPKKDRAFATSIFNAGSTVGALIAPLSIPTLAKYFQTMGVGNGWEMAFILIGALGFIWMGLWLFLYKPIDSNPRVNKAELEYIRQDAKSETTEKKEKEKEKKISYGQCLKYRQTWEFAIGKFMTDAVWWFFLFWTPAYISDVYGFSSNTGTAQRLIFVLYAITMLSIYGGKLPTVIINKTGKNPYDARMRAMFIFALFPLIALFAQPLGKYSYWFPIIIIGIVGAAHQSWSANIYSVVSDMIPNRAVATVTSIGQMAGGISSFLINMFSGVLFDHAAATGMTFMGFQGKPAGYFIVFCICSIAYLVGWCIMKALVPHYKPIEN